MMPKQVHTCITWKAIKTTGHILLTGKDIRITEVGITPGIEDHLHLVNIGNNHATDIITIIIIIKETTDLDHLTGIGSFHPVDKEVPIKDDPPHLITSLKDHTPRDETNKDPIIILKIGNKTGHQEEEIMVIGVTRRIIKGIIPEMADKLLGTDHHITIMKDVGRPVHLDRTVCHTTQTTDHLGLTRTNALDLHQGIDLFAKMAP